MQFHVNTLDARRHRAFLEQQGRDPVSKKTFEVGDRVVMCAACRSAFLESSWRGCGGSHCGQQKTLRDIVVNTASRPHTRRGSDPGAHNDDAAESGAAHDAAHDATALPHMPPAGQDDAHVSGGGAAVMSVKPAEVPLRLADVPIQLRPVIVLRKI